ncbi:MAG TPA: hypothetical protein VMG41_11340 [Gemmatimonadales bacterium]|nr:hypothetical protein [Gemmatimonadales bacterium]
MMQAVPVPPVPPVPPVVVTTLPGSWWAGLPPEVIGVVSVAFLTATVLVLYPLMRALSRRIERASGDPQFRAEVEGLHERLAEVDALRERVAELEERLDFTERLLTRAQGAERLERGPG